MFTLRQFHRPAKAAGATALRRCFTAGTTTAGDSPSPFDAPFLRPTAANRVPLTPTSFLNHTARLYPNVMCYHHGNTGLERTWAQVLQRCCALASAFETRLGVRRNDVVSIVAPNTPQHYETIFACAGARAVLHAVNTRSDPATVAFQLAHARTKVLMVDSEHFPLVQQALVLVSKEDAALVRGMKVVEVYDVPTDGTDRAVAAAAAFSSVAEVVEYEELLSTPLAPGYAGLKAPVDEYDAITLAYTSGTTGNPKGVVTHHRGAYLNSMANAVTGNWPQHPKFLWVVPLFHCVGWCYPWTIAMKAGHNYFLRQVRAEPIFDLVTRHRIHYLAGAPVIMNTLLAHPQRYKFQHPVEAVFGGAPPPPAVIARFEAEIGVKTTCAYGMTEMYGPVCTHHPDPDWLTADPPPTADALLAKRIYLSPDATVEELRVMDPETLTPVPADGETIGEVMVRGNIVMKGYLRNEHATREALAGGWMHTGDLAVDHGHNRIEICDRSKDIIISGGENISSIAVENRLQTHPWVGETAVVAMDDETWGEVPVAFVAPRPGLGIDTTTTTTGAAELGVHGDVLRSPSDTLTAADLMAWARKHMAGYETPKRVVYVDALPKTSTGKTQKHLLRSQLGLFFKR